VLPLLPATTPPAVYKAVCKRSNEIVVLKSYQLSSICELYQHQIFREVGLHAALAHENVVQLSAAFQVRLSSDVYSKMLKFMTCKQPYMFVRNGTLVLLFEPGRRCA
jgi:serine/threonine protein kinase